MRFFLPLAFGLFIFTSCSVGKIVNARAYKTSNRVENIDSKKYGTEFKKKDKKNEKYERPKLASSIKTEKQRDISLSNNPSTEKNHFSSPSLSVDKLIIEENINQVLSSNYTIIEKIQKNFSDSTDEEEDIRRIDPVSVSSFTIGLLGVLSVVLAFVFLDSGLVFPVLLFLGIGLLITAFILGLIGIRRKIKNRKKYKGVVFAILGFVGGVMGMILLLLIIVLIAAYSV
jgi:VIT1/CCC1 family predicted Fe2+/Mn2+ transporter